MKLLFKNALIYSDVGFYEAHLAVENGVISAISKIITEAPFDKIYDVKNCHLIPGAADVHVHLREPGFSCKETIRAGTMAAAKGGVTAVCSMPNLDPVPDSLENLRVQLDKINASAVIPVLPYASITKSQSGAELVDFKALAPFVVGFSDDGKGIQDKSMMREAMYAVKETGKLIAAHCEDESLSNSGYIHDGAYAKTSGHKGIPSECEWRQIERDLDLVKETGCRYHVCHLSTKEGVSLVRQSKNDGLPVTAETAPHYIALCDADLKDEGRFKMNPPIRSEEDKNALIEGICDGTVDIIATDHAPHSFDEKNKGLKDSLMGISGLETSLPVIYTSLVKTGLIDLNKYVYLISISPRNIMNIKYNKILPIEIADFTIIDFNAYYTINPDKFISKGKSTPFDGESVYGEVKATVYKDNLYISNNITGKV
ncbi:MAG: dihydroorotase [Oscillospiraceae bacterium]|nr:dihydroorotase [Oscillospiraceae bacterium]